MVPTPSFASRFMGRQPSRMWSATLASHSWFFRSCSTRVMSKRLSRGPDREVFTERDTLESYVPCPQQGGEPLWGVH